MYILRCQDRFTKFKNLCQVTYSFLRISRAGNFWMVDIGIKAWSTLFLNLEIKKCLFSFRLINRSGLRISHSKVFSSDFCKIMYNRFFPNTDFLYLYCFHERLVTYVSIGSSRNTRAISNRSRFSQRIKLVIVNNADRILWESLQSWIHCDYRITSIHCRKMKIRVIYFC